ncbi:MAG: hypothetical protein ACI9EF_001079 [Pseudohongiellaceae bacterium]|jgi:hypothetical protein
MSSLLPALLALAGLVMPPDDIVQVTARMADTALVVDEISTFTIDVTFAEGAAASAAGLPAPVLQLDVPASMKLEGPYLTTLRQLSGNEHLQHPFERMIKTGGTTVEFTLQGEPAEGETLGIIVSGYVTTSETAFFLRKRLELPLTAGAEAVAGDDRNSSWGTDEDLLKIGQAAPAISLPSADGQQTLDLDEHLGSSNVLLVTYRAFW